MSDSTAAAEASFSGWTIRQLSEYIRDVGGNPDGCDSKEELISTAARLAVAAEKAALGGGSGSEGNGGMNAPAPTAPPSRTMTSSSLSAYPEIEYAEQPRRHDEGQQQQALATTTATATTGNPFAPSPSVPASMPAANSVSGSRKRALLIGCNYRGTSAELQGCENDANCLRYLLISRFGFAAEDVTILLDGSPWSSQWPTRNNILWHTSALSSSARSGDVVFWSFSGHGAQVPDQSGDEADGLSETICPCDFQAEGSGGGMILDDELNLSLVRPLQQGVRAIALIDSCHSGSVLNLEFRAKARDGPLVWKQEYAWQPRTYKGTQGGLCVGISASRDKQVAADTSQLSGTHTGAATFTFIQSIEAYGTHITYEALLRSMKAVLDASVNAGGPSAALASLGLGGGGGGGGGGGAVGGIMGKLNSLLSGALDAAGMSGQTPCLTSNFAFDLNTPLGI